MWTGWVSENFLLLNMRINYYFYTILRYVLFRFCLQLMTKVDVVHKKKEEEQIEKKTQTDSQWGIGPHWRKCSCSKWYGIQQCSERQKHVSAWYIMCQTHLWPYYQHTHCHWNGNQDPTLPATQTWGYGMWWISPHIHGNQSTLGSYVKYQKGINKIILLRHQKFNT